MIFERFEDDGLSQYSYAVGCEAAAGVAVVDPSRTVERYLGFAESRGVKISHVLETHIHADFASGARELAQRSGARLMLSAHDDGEDYEVAFDHAPLEDGASLEIGSVRLQAVHTPGHTPEHLSFLAFDGARSRDVPMLMLSGDFLFVGSLGRPDLLGEEAKHALAGQLYDSARRRLAGLPDGLEIHPGHGAGSMCGSGMGGRPQSTLGFERIANPYLDPSLTREAFIERVLGDVPPFPPYYRRMKQLNAAGPPRLDGRPAPRAVAPAEFAGLAAADHAVLDVRSVERYAAGHLRGSFSLPATRLLSQWAAWVVPYDTPLLLVAPDAQTIGDAVERLVRVGLDDVSGYLDGGIEAWRAAGRPLETHAMLDAARLARRRSAGEAIDVLDVRSDGEWASGHIEDAVHVFGGRLADEIDRVPRRGRPLAVLCETGYRSSVAASVLERAGFDGLIHVPDGMRGWKQAGLPVARS